MTLKTKLVVSFLGCGLIPLSIVAYVNFSTASKGLSAIQDKSRVSLEQKSYAQLV